MGWTVKVVHSPDSDLYAHANACPLGAPSVNVVQGRHISYTGTRATANTSVGDHVHFQRNSPSTGGEGTPQIAVAFVMEGKSSFTHSQEVGNTAVSDNLAAGYTTPPVQWEQAIHDKAFSLGWNTAGATASLSGFTPGRTPGVVCNTTGPATPGWYQCNFTDINGVSRTGRVQTFKGVGAGSGEHAIFKRGTSAATFMSRGLLGPFTRVWGSNKDGLYYMGYPTGDSYWISGTHVRMDFQNSGSYALYAPATCASIFYYWFAAWQQYFSVSPTQYCD
jgi:hypothetical protein